MNAVGYDLYCKMLSEAVKEAKGIHTMEDFETTIDLNMDAFIPDTYISNEFQKLDIYKRIAGIESQQEYDDMLEELIDRFGEPPKSVMNLLEITKVKSMARRLYIKEVKGRPDQITFTMYEKAQINAAKIPDLLARMDGALTFRKTEPVQFAYTSRSSRQDFSGKLLETTERILEEMEVLLEDAP